MMSKEDQKHSQMIKETLYSSSDTVQQTVTETITTTSSHVEGYVQQQLFIKSTRPRYLDIIDDPQAFQFFVQRQLSLDEDPTFQYTSRSASPISATDTFTTYEPILGYENLNDIYKYSQNFETHEPSYISNRLTDLYTAIQVWDLDQVERIIDNERFNQYLRVLRNEESGIQMDQKFKNKIIKKMIIEQIASIVRPLKNEHDRDIIEKELNLIILLNSDTT